MVIPEAISYWEWLTNISFALGGTAFLVPILRPQ
jgi:hypothetical protein